MKELLAKRYELWVRMLWLKTINKEVDKRNKAYEKYQRKAYVVKKLVEEYNRKYGDRRTSESEDTE